VKSALTYILLEGLISSRCDISDIFN